MSETSIQLQTQASAANTSISLDSAGRPIIPHIDSQARKQTKYKPRFAEFSAGANEVFRYAVLVTKAVIPKAFWGSEHNFEVIVLRTCSLFSTSVGVIAVRVDRHAHACTDVKHMILARRYETSTVHNVLQGFRTADCDWLMPHTAGALKQARVSVTDALKRRELVEDFLFWYFDGFLLPLLKVSIPFPFLYIEETCRFTSMYAGHLLRDRIFRVPKQCTVLPARRLAHLVRAARAEAEHGHLSAYRSGASLSHPSGTMLTVRYVARGPRDPTAAEVGILVCAPSTEGDRSATHCQSPETSRKSAYYTISLETWV